VNLTVNLRSDLAQLSDDELAERLSQAWKDYETARQDADASGYRLWLSARAPIRHAAAHAFLSVAGIRRGWHFSGLAVGGLFRGANPAFDMHRSLCDIQDMHEEIERRVAERRGARP
jgi:hypothetical protein